MQYFDRRGGANRYKIKTDFFKTWSNKMAYVLGFLYADGDIVDAAKSSRTQYIKFSNKDKNILLSIKNVLQSEHPIHYRPAKETIDRHGRSYKSSGLFYLRVGNQRMFADLKKLGLVPNKSKVIKFPDIMPDKYLSYFIRGYFDGDGSIMFNKKRWIRVVFTSGSKDFLKGLSYNLSKVLKIRKRLVKVSHYSYQLYYFTQEGLKLLNFIYRDAEKDRLYLNKKYKFYKKISLKYNYILEKYIAQVAT